MILELDNIVVDIQKTPILRGLSLTIDDGEFIGLVGRNGAGKTTTLRTIMGIIAPVSGSVKLLGKDMAGVEAHDRPSLGIGYMPEDRRLVPQLTVEENILLPSWVIEGLDHEGSLKLHLRSDARTAEDERPQGTAAFRRAAKDGSARPRFNGGHETAGAR